MIHKSVILFGLVCLLSNYCNAAASRKIDMKLNPGCVEPCVNPYLNGSYINLLYVTATGADDIVHYIYSNIGSFTILMFRTSLSGKLSIDWDKLLSDDSNKIFQSITVAGADIKETNGYSMPMIYEFNDENGLADMTQIVQNETYWNTYSTSQLVWSKFNTNFSSSSLGVFEAKLAAGQNGSFKFVIKTPGSDVRDKELPHLLLNPESTSVDFIVNSIESRFRLSKFAIELMFVSNCDNFNLASKTTMDDEYTPGTFKLWNIELSSGNTTQSFFQWKPIFYYQEPRSLEDSTLTKQYDVHDKLALPSGVANALFNANTSFAHGLNISFGIEGNEKDGYFYNQTNFNVWSFSAGLGAPPVERMSFVVTLVIIVGFGLPALIIVVGILVMLVRKIKNSRRSEFEEL